jgi:hypothetical protein
MIERKKSRQKHLNGKRKESPNEWKLELSEREFLLEKESEQWELKLESMLQKERQKWEFELKEQKLTEINTKLENRVGSFLPGCIFI